MNPRQGKFMTVLLPRLPHNVFMRHILVCHKLITKSVNTFLIYTEENVE